MAGRRQKREMVVRREEKSSRSCGLPFGADLSQKPRCQKTNQIEDIVCRGDAGPKKFFKKQTKSIIYIYIYSYMYIFIFLVAIGKRSSKRTIRVFFDAKVLSD